MSRTSTHATVYSVLFLLAFVLTLVMLFTDTNLKTDFGAMSSGYFSHWYVVLVTGIADIVGAALLVAVRSRTAIKAGMVGSGLLALIFVADISTYSQVGFSSASSFANYLFGVNYYGGDIRYLYVSLLAVYLLTFLVGIVLVMMSRADSRPPAKVWVQSASPPPPTSP